jgi:antirestriction protein ArdC
MNKAVEIAVKQILEITEKDELPWIKGWNSTAGIAPRNLITDAPYQGINSLFTRMQGYSSPYWLSFKQAKEAGGTVIKGQKGTKIIWASKVEKKNPEEGEKDHYMAFRYSAIFNLEQTENVKIPKKIQEQIDARIEKLKNPPNKEEINELNISFDSLLETYIKMEKSLKVIEGNPAYAPKTDTIRMPMKEVFHSFGEYLGTKTHECVHSTGHWLRLDRFKKDAPVYNGKDSYAFEELIAEIGAAFLCAEFGVEKIFENQKAYIAGWKKRLTDDTGMLVKACSQAQKAVNYIKGEK